MSCESGRYGRPTAYIPFCLEEDGELLTSASGADGRWGRRCATDGDLVVGNFLGFGADLDATDPMLSWRREATEK